jgi:dihydroorotase
MVKTGIITIEKLIEIMSENPKKRFGIQDGDSYSIWKLDEEYVVNSNEFISLGKATPFEGYELNAVNYLTVTNGKITYEK